MSNKSKTQETNRAAPEAVLPKMIRDRIFPHLIYVAAKLGIADLLADGPKSSAELAKAVKAQPHALYRVLRALASRGIFAETEDGCFELTPIAAPLQSGVPGSVRAWAIMTGENWFQHPFGELLYCVRTGKDAFSYVHGKGLFEYLKEDSEAGQIFNEVMSKLTEPQTDAVVAAYDFAGISNIVDIGGGKGTLIAAVLKANPRMQGVLYDLPYVVEEAKRVIKAEDLTDRCELIAGDMFESVPGGEVYILKRILHDWHDEHSISILKNCRRAIANNGRLLVVEGVVPAGNEPSQMKTDDINMMVVAGGLERTRAEFSALFDAAGFKLAKVFPTQSTLSIVEGVPVQ